MFMPWPLPVLPGGTGCLSRAGGEVKGFRLSWGGIWAPGQAWGKGALEAPGVSAAVLGGLCGQPRPAVPRAPEQTGRKVGAVGRSSMLERP